MAGLVLSIAVLATASIVPYATAGMPVISFINFDRNGMQVETGDCGSSDSITYITRGKLIVKLTDGSESGTEFTAPGGTNRVFIKYDPFDITNGIVKIEFIRTTTSLEIIDTGLGGATSFDIKAPRITGTSSFCGFDAPKGTTSGTVFISF